MVHRPLTSYRNSYSLFRVSSLAAGILVKGSFHLRKILLLAAILILSNLNAFAQPNPRIGVLRNAYSVMTSEIPASQDIARVRGFGWQDSKLRFNLEIFGEGVVAIRFDRTRMRDWTAQFVDGAGKRRDDQTETILLRGLAKSRARDRDANQGRLRSQEIAGAMMQRGNHRQIEIYLRGQGVNGHTRFFKVTAKYRSDLGRYSVKVSRAPDFALADMGCDDHNVSINPGVTTPGSAIKVMAATKSGKISGAKPKSIATSAVNSLPLLFTTIGLEADHLAYAQFGENTASQLASILNVVDGIYRSQLDLAFTIGATTVRTSSETYPALYTDAEVLLEYFRNQSLADAARPNVDLIHLVTGRDLDGSTVGLAYVGVVCSAPEYMYGLSQYINEALTPIITAHEIGHNFGAVHTATGIMSTTLGDPPPTSFSSESLTQINSYLSQNAQCLNFEDGSSGPAGTSPTIALKASLGGSSFKARIDIGSIVDGCTITLRGAASPTKAKTGKAIFTVAPGGTRLVASAKLPRRLPSGSVISFVAEYNCPGRTTSYSVVRKVKPTGQQSGKLVSVSAWLKSLQALFS